jgi:hypothetical protein
MDIGNMDLNVKVEKVDNSFNVTVTDFSQNPPVAVQTTVRTYGKKTKPVVRAFEVALNELVQRVSQVNEVTSAA